MCRQPVIRAPFKGCDAPYVFLIQLLLRQEFLFMPGKVKLMKNTSGVLNRYGNGAIRQQDEVRMKKGIRVMVLNNTFNNISVISWQSVSLGCQTMVKADLNLFIRCAKKQYGMQS
jgi:hypothetical protein